MIGNGIVGGWPVWGVALAMAAAALLMGGCADPGDEGPGARPRQRPHQADAFSPFEPRPAATPPAPSPAVEAGSQIPPPGSNPTAAFEPPTESIERLDEQTTFLIILDAPEAQTAPPPIDSATLQEIINERETLRRELRRIDEQAAEIARIPIAPPPPAQAPVRGARFAGTVRDLDLASAPPDVAEAVMARRGIRRTRTLSDPSAAQDFLSGAVSADGQRFTARPASQPQIVNALLISPATIAHMARMERLEIEKRGLNPARTHVRRVVFGIVGSGADADLGVLQMEATPVEGPSP